jgi:hypothetical protein
MRKHIGLLLMSILQFPIMGFGYASASGLTWDWFFKMGTIAVGFFTAVGGFLIMVMSGVYWMRKLRRQAMAMQQEKEVPGSKFQISDSTNHKSPKRRRIL